MTSLLSTTRTERPTRRGTSVLSRADIHTQQTWNWVIGSPGQWVIFHVRVTGSSFWPGVRFFRFLKKAEDKDIKIYIFVKIRPTAIEILTFNKWSSKFYFPEACKRQTAIKTGNLLPIANVCLQHKSTLGVHYRTGSRGHKMWSSSMSDLPMARSANDDYNRTYRGLRFTWDLILHVYVLQ